MLITGLNGSAQRSYSRRAGIAGAILSIAISIPVSANPVSLTPLGPGANASVYAGTIKSTVFATGLSFPSSMQQYGDGILVGTTQGGSIYSSTAAGHLLLLTDIDHDGVADQTADLTPAGGLPGGITSVRRAGNLLFVTDNVSTTSPIISVLKQGATPTSPFTTVGTINLGVSYPSWEHTSYALATRPTPGQAGKYDLLFNVGSRANDTSDVGNYSTYHATATTSGNAVGLSNAQLDPESIYKTTVAFDGTTASFSAPVKVAGGLRNSAGIAFEPGSGDLYYEDNGMDGSAANGHPNDSHGNAAYSVDTLHKINAADIGVRLPTSNFATDFYENTPPTPTVHGSPDAIARFASFGPYDSLDHNASPNESEGANEIAFAPATFPASLSDGVFVGFHGQFNQVGPPSTTPNTGNEEHPVVFYNATTGSYWHFIGNQEPDVGHLDGLLSTSDSLYLADLTDENIFGPSSDGTIYQLSVVQIPGDATRDGVVNFNDLVVLAQHYGLTSGGDWDLGDFNGDHAINFADLVILAQNYVGTSAITSQLDPAFAVDWTLAQSLAPEPTILGVFAVGVIAALRRRRA